MVYRTIIHLNIELQIPVIYRADFGLRGFTPFNTKILMILKRYKSTEVDRRIWLHVPSETLVHQQWHSPGSWNFKRDLLNLPITFVFFYCYINISCAKNRKPYPKSHGLQNIKQNTFYPFDPLTKYFCFFWL